LQRFWLKTPRYGQIAIFDRSWYREVLDARVRGRLDAAAWRERCDEIGAFERHLADDGAVVVKFWLHIDRKEQRRRLKRLAADRVTAWQVAAEDRWQQRHYHRVRRTFEDLMARTDAPYAPWVVLPATDRRYAQLTMVETVVEVLGQRLGVETNAVPRTPEALADEGGAALRHQLDVVRGVVPAPARAPALAAPRPAPLAPSGILARVDLQRRAAADAGQEQARLQAKLHLLGFEVYRQQRPVVIVFEGWDAAGKGGAIHRITAEIDPRSYIVHAIAAPSGDDSAHHYLYRFWRRLPTRGQIAIFDRSWYGRVLVERVEGFAQPGEWQRAYTEINEFERQLVHAGTIVCKFWMHISAAEQLRRFEERQAAQVTAWKLTREDWRNREQWPAYEVAAEEMLLRTATPTAPWTVVEAEEKRYGRLKVLRTAVDRLEAELGKVRL
jgi:polyphosphate kinase 2 (PPK2 family)